MSEFPLYPSLDDLFPIPLPFYGLAIALSGGVSLFVVMRLTASSIRFERFIRKARRARGEPLAEAGGEVITLFIKTLVVFAVLYPVIAWLLRAFASPLIG